MPGVIPINLFYNQSITNRNVPEAAGDHGSNGILVLLLLFLYGTILLLELLVKWRLIALGSHRIDD